MSLWVTSLCLVVLIGSGLAIDMPFVFDENSSDLASYDSHQLEAASALSHDLKGVPPVSSPNDYEMIEVILPINESFNKSSADNDSIQSQDALSGFAPISQQLADNETNLSHRKFSVDLPPTYIIVSLPVIYPKGQSYWFEEGNRCYANGSYQKAIECYDQAINLDPELKEVWCNKGLALCRLEKYKEALKAFDQALIICPEYKKAWRCKGQALDAMGRDDEAKEAFQNAG